ncbi:MAG: arginine--tRNA ligase [Candidatus Aenigmarchaeota archaeon]|nr:arginine--tRNA ligase [Candidatus Aenigmarchaeota archaeon]
MSWEKFKAECEKLAGGRVEIPPKEVNADLAFACFGLAKSQKRNPFEIAKELEQKLAGKKFVLIKNVSASGPYLNFYVNYEKFGTAVLKDIMKQKTKYGSGKKKKEVILVEFPGPNTNKPLHLGHMRTMTLGISISNMMRFLGYRVKNVDIINDRGVHICKSMLAYREFGGGEPDKKPDHFVGDFYVLFAKKLEGQEGAEQKIREMLVDWENGDPATRSLWKKMNRWAIEGFTQTYRRFGVHTDKSYFESDHYLRGKKIVMDGLKKNIFTKDPEGNIIIDLGERSLGKRVLLRGDGTSVYITQDMALAVERYKDFAMDRMIYVVGEEQRDHFRALFSILEILGYKFAKQCHHLSYGMVNLPEGRMKSREGTVVDADDLMDEMHRIAEEKLRERNVPESEIKSRAEKIGLGAIKYFIVKFDPVRSMTYDPKASIEFEGDTGPYLQYTYARANSILEKSTKKARAGHLDNEKEHGIAKKLSQFPLIVEKSAEEFKPNLLANYLFELATLFNDFYHSVRVVGEKNEAERLALVSCVMQVLENGLDLLGIETLKEM